MPTEAQLSDPSLRLRIRERIGNGQLPVMIPKQSSGGYGSGKTCSACDHPITSTQIEYEVEDERDGRQLSFHFGCHVVWQLECAQQVK